MASMFDGVDYTAICLCLLFIVGDIVTGFTKAIANRVFSSKVIREGLFHKAGTIMLLVASVLVDVTMGYAGLELPFNLNICKAVCVMVIIMELTSILENCLEINPELDKVKIFKIFGIEKDRKDDSMDVAGMN